MIVINLPRLVSSRESARRLLAEAADTVKGDRVVVNCRELRSAAESFVDELVKVILIEGDAAELVVLGASSQFLEQAHRAAKVHGVDGRIVERPAGSEVEA